MRIKLAILDSDLIYLKRIVSLFNSKYAADLEVYSFTEMETAISNLSSNKIDVFLASDTFDIEVTQIPSKCGFAYFVEDADVESLNEQKAICKFQRVDLIYKQIVSVYSEHAPNIKEATASQGKAKTICFAPVSGGTGASTLAVSASKYLASKGKKVLYFALEEFSNPDLYFSGEGNECLTDIIYAIKSKKANWPLKLKSVVKIDESNVSFFSQAHTELDVMELNFEDRLELITELVTSGDYDYVIIDSDFSLDGEHLKLFNSLSSTILVCDGTPVSVSKLKRAYSSLQILSEQKEWNLLARIGVIYNRFSSKTGMQADIDINVIGGTPVYAQATNEQIIDQLSKMELFEKLV